MLFLLFMYKPWGIQWLIIIIKVIVIPYYITTHHIIIVHNPVSWINMSSFQSSSDKTNKSEMSVVALKSISIISSKLLFSIFIKTAKKSGGTRRKYHKNRFLHVFLYEMAFQQLCISKKNDKPVTLRVPLETNDSTWHHLFSIFFMRPDKTFPR